MATFSPNTQCAFFTYGEPDLAGRTLAELANNSIDITCWNLKFDAAMAREGFAFDPLWSNLKFTDAMLLQRIATPHQSARLKIASQQYIPEESRIDVVGPERAVKAWLSSHRERERVGGKYVITFEPNYSHVPPEIMVPYAAQDTVLTAYAREALVPLIEASEGLKRTAEREHKLCAVVLEMERMGWPVNVTTLARLKAQAQFEIGENTSLFMDIAPGVNPGSSQQLGEYLYTQRGFPIGTHTTPSGAPSTDESALRDIPDETVREPLLNIRRWVKCLDKCNEFEAALTASNRVHSTYNQSAARTGRFSSEAPQLQNLSRFVPDQPWTHARSLVEAEPGRTLVFVDLSAIEMRLFAEYARDPVLLEAFEKDQDPHSVVAAMMFSWTPAQLEAAFRGELTPEMKQQRSFGKLLSFTILYGGGVDRVADSLRAGDSGGEPMTTAQALEALATLKPGVRPEGDVLTDLAATLIATYKRAFPSVRQFTKRASQLVEKRQREEGVGYVDNLFGRRSIISPGKSYVAVNALIQSCAADLLKEAMIAIDADLDDRFGPSYNQPDAAVKFIGTVHDELIFDVEDEFVESVANAVVKHMTNFPQIKVPLKAEVSVSPHGTHWGEKYNYDAVHA
jgi:DNA polymerase-1